MSFLIFLIVLSALVLIHELGHFLAARMFGVKAEEFGYGFPPRLIGFVKDGGKWKRVGTKDTKSYKNTIWSINWLPLGGFVRIKGEQTDGINDADSIHMKPIWQRLVIIAAGVIMNWFTAAVIFSFIFSIGTQTILEDLPADAQVKDRVIMITDVLPSSPAAQAGIQPGDRIISIDGVALNVMEDARQQIQTHGTQAFALTLMRAGQTTTTQVTPKEIAELKRPGIGVAMADVGTVSFTIPQAIKNGVLMTFRLTRAVLEAFGGLIRDLVVTRQVTQDVSGPVGIAVMTGRVAQQGIIPLLQFAAMLSINLAVINFLPIPALDGGRAVFLVIEKLRRKPISRPLEIAIHNVAFLVLILLIVVVTAHDIAQYGGVILGGMKGLVGR